MPSPLQDVVDRIEAGDLPAALALALALPLAEEGADRDHAALLAASLLRQLNRAEEALAILTGLALHAPQATHVRLEMAKAHEMLGNREEAANLLRPVVTQVPGHSASSDLARLLQEMGLARLEAGDAAAALTLLQEAAAYNYTLPDLMGSLGLALLHLEHFQAAEQVLRTALQLYPEHPTTMINLAAALDNLNQYDEAEALCRRVVGNLAPEMPEGWCNLGAVLRSQGRFEEAEEALAKALALNPELVAAVSNLATLHSQQGDFDRSLALYRQALALAPDQPVLHFLMAMDRLKAGDWETGWQFYEERGRYKVQWPAMAGLPVWPGGDPAGLRILLADEQGFGDILQFYRYAWILADQGAQVGLACHPALHRLFAHSDPRITLFNRDHTGQAADWDFGLPLLSLPHRFATRVDHVPATIPYLGVAADARAAWADRLATLPGRRVGLVWAGDPRPYNPAASGIDARRSLALSTLAPLATVAGISFVSLQKGPAAAQCANAPFPIHDWTAELGDFADTAALTAQLDMVISVDTAMAHLAGGLGVPVMMLSRYDGCWRWLHGRDDTPWYPTMRLFRQRRWCDWSDPIAELLAALSV
jgi:tetratricopeptide (TPR) repeat protein